MVDRAEPGVTPLTARMRAFAEARRRAGEHDDRAVAAVVDAWADEIDAARERLARLRGTALEAAGWLEGHTDQAEGDAATAARLRAALASGTGETE
jgi:hypothetical protein